MDSMTDSSVAVVSSPAKATQLLLVSERRGNWRTRGIVEKRFVEKMGMTDDDTKEREK